MDQLLYRIAIVGAGPSGYFAAQALQNSASEEQSFAIDMIERLPTPWGLVRSGVAPDHPKIKTVSKVFEKIASEPNFRLFGTVELGKDISLDDLTNKYDAVIMATGSSIGKRLGIPGEDLANSISAAEFVPWYNGHPDFADFKVDLSGKVAVVIGAGRGARRQRAALRRGAWSGCSVVSVAEKWCAHRRRDGGHAHAQRAHSRRCLGI